ncbi:hypothetical protein [Solimonas sp. SE-A11]|uniref:hypothetical protein n=1 Tax=Solimonas sp. SE-A11 TaxID=3054954 RepID=UPI00259CAB91|nr:hypothetical protein [Solimonas sp. SE-A11]MDM4771503.1 hypothetical protein [Solimonas sp. SE-A11]
MSRSPKKTASLKPFLGSVILSCCAALAACDGASSSDTESPSSETPLYSAEIGCTGASGPLDNLQTGLADRLNKELADQPGGAAYAGQLASLVTQALDLVDALATGAGSLAALRSGGDPSLLAPVYHELLCVTAAVAELVLSASLGATTPLAEQQVLQGLLGTLVELQKILLLGSQALPSVLDPGQIAEDLGYVTQTLAGVVASLANTLSVLPGGLGDAVLMPVAGLLLDVTASLNALGSGDTQAFAQLLIDSVTHLLEALADGLGPLGIFLDAVIALLAPVLRALAAQLGGLLGIVL